MWNDIFEKTDYKSDVSINDESDFEKSVYPSPMKTTEDILKFIIQLSVDEYTAIESKTKLYCNNNKTRKYFYTEWMDKLNLYKICWNY